MDPQTPVEELPITYHPITLTEEETQKVLMLFMSANEQDHPNKGTTVKEMDALLRAIDDVRINAALVENVLDATMYPRLKRGKLEFRVTAKGEKLVEAMMAQPTAEEAL